jgi:2-deoxy-D-gluconate 3-dehydrogenase
VIFSRQLVTNFINLEEIIYDLTITMEADYLQQTFSLDGKTAVVTGATGGLGRSLAAALAKAGASTIVSIEIPNDQNSPDLEATIKGLGRSFLRFECDLANNADVRSCYAKIWEAGVIPDILVNCAGVIRRKPCEDATDDDLDLVGLS